jgi:hypothetical protein
VPRVKPKKKCCGSKPRCRRCPIRLLADGALPPGYTVRKRRLVRLEGALAGDLGSLSTEGDKKKKKNKKKKQKQKQKAKVRASSGAGSPRPTLAA